MESINVSRIEDIIRTVAATEIVPRFRKLQPGDVREKRPDDYVTIADEASEQALTRLLSEAVPGSLVVGEEAVSKDPEVLKRLKGSHPVWVVDPIDGTYNFMHGRSYFGVLVSLVYQGRTEYAFAYDIPGNRMAFAQRGHGAWLDGQSLKIKNNKAHISEMVGQGGGAQAWHFAPLKSFFKDIVNLRCSLHDFMNFYTGAADFVVHINKTTPWDHAAPCLIAAEAGAHIAHGERGGIFDPTFLGPSFLLVTPSADWNQQMFPLIRQALGKESPLHGEEGR